VIVAVQHSSVLLEWSYDGDKRQISHFQVQQQEFGRQEWKIITTVGALTTTQVKVMGLFPFTAYQFRVLSINNNRASSASQSSEIVVTAEATPTAEPVNIQVIDSNYTAIAMVWQVSTSMTTVYLLFSVNAHTV